MAHTRKTTQDFVPIKNIRDNVVLLKDGRMCMVLLASSINFALKSLDEQRAILGQFQSFLNTIDFSLQFYTQSRRLDISPYLELLREREPLQDNDLMRVQLREYMKFVETFTTEVDVMAKNFFIVISYSPGSTVVSGGIKSLFSKRNNADAETTTFEEHRLQLEQRASMVEQGLNRIGVKTITLENEALVELYYHIFNPNEDTRTAPKHR